MSLASLPDGAMGTWKFASIQHEPKQGSRTFPSVRYSASAVEYRGDLIVTHGYFYNHAIRHPAWQSDAWAFNFGTRKWRKLHDGENAGAPSARYSASAVQHDGALWMYGGDDGGHKTSMFNYIFEAWFDELWRFDLRSYVWNKVQYKSPVSPPKRALHAAVAIGRHMYVYGGLELSDTWRWDFDASTWQLMIPGQEEDATHPGRRHALAATTPSGAEGFYIFGGCRHVKSGRPLAFNDLWYYSIGRNAWTKLAPTAGLPTPSARSHLSFVSLTSRMLLLYGGALCVPGCTCYGDLWLWDVEAKRWAELNASDAPIHRYRQSLVVHPTEGAVYLFGGESYKPYMYHNAVNRLELPPSIASEAIREARGSTGAVAASGAVAAPGATLTKALVRR